MNNQPTVYPDWKPSGLAIGMSVLAVLCYIALFATPFIFIVWMVAADDPILPLIFMYLVMIGISLVMAAVMLISQWKLYTKAGQPGWKCLIPIYNSWVLNEIAGYQGYYVLFAFIPLVGSFFMMLMMVLVYMSLAEKFGKSKAWGIVMLLLLTPVGIPVLGLSDNTYIPSRGHQMEDGLFDI